MGLLDKAWCSLILQLGNIQLWEGWWPLREEVRACCCFYHDEGSWCLWKVPLGAMGRQAGWVEFGVMLEGQTLRRAV